MKSHVATLTFTGDTGPGGPTWAAPRRRRPDDGCHLRPPPGPRCKPRSGPRPGDGVQLHGPGLHRRSGVAGHGAAQLPHSDDVPRSPRRAPCRRSPGARAPSGVSWVVQGCSSLKVTAPAPPPWPPNRSSSAAERRPPPSTGVRRPCYYRYRVIGTDMATELSKAGPPGLRRPRLILVRSAAAHHRSPHDDRRPALSRVRRPDSGRVSRGRVGAAPGSCRPWCGRRRSAAGGWRTARVRPVPPRPHVAWKSCARLAVLFAMPPW